MTKHFSFHCLFLAAVFCLLSCAPVKSQSRKDKHKHDKYEEDISSYRLKYIDSTEIETPKTKVAVAPTNDVTKVLNIKLDTLARRNNSVKNIQGYRILVYSGKSSQEVQKVRAKVYECVPNGSIYIDFKSPNQRVKVGDCVDRVEAYSLYGKLKKTFPNAVIIPDQIAIKAK